ARAHRHAPHLSRYSFRNDRTALPSHGRLAAGFPGLPVCRGRHRDRSGRLSGRRRAPGAGVAAGRQADEARESRGGGGVAGRGVRREKGEGRREKGEGRREKGEGRREKGEGRREKTPILLPSSFSLTFSRVPRNPASPHPCN